MIKYCNLKFKIFKYEYILDLNNFEAICRVNWLIALIFRALASKN